MDTIYILTCLLTFQMSFTIILCQSNVVESIKVKHSKKQLSLFGLEIFSLTSEDPHLIGDKLDENTIYTESKSNENIQLDENIVNGNSVNSKDIMQILQSFAFQSNDLVDLFYYLPETSWQTFLIVAFTIKLVYTKIKRKENNIIECKCKCNETNEKFEIQINKLIEDVASLIEDRHLIFELLRERNEHEIEKNKYLSTTKIPSPLKAVSRARNRIK